MESQRLYLRVAYMVISIKLNNKYHAIYKLINKHQFLPAVVLKRHDSRAQAKYFSSSEALAGCPIKWVYCDMRQ